MTVAAPAKDKNGRGLYRYRRDGDGYESVGGADDTVYELLGVERREGAVPPRNPRRALRLALRPG